MLAVSVESRPLNGTGTLGTPIEFDFSVVMLDMQLPTLERRWETNDKRCNLVFRAGCVDMFLKDSRWARIYLEEITVSNLNQRIDRRGGVTFNL